MRDLGSIQSPQNAFYLNIGLETLHLRMPRHVENAQKVAEFLASNPKVAWVNYAGLKGDKYYDLAQKYCPNGCHVRCRDLQCSPVSIRSYHMLFQYHMRIHSYAHLS